ncbi:hypothetical protein GP486_001307 [Trichoglossum hirsutum]|uniref:Mitochondrial chaperone BCS1 n=1 Tax=Trichoglossum hirsutum TaxID=265104 RepID=A0A9P8RT63_9PEZI|nr:hypothetical protein GP486_001307 [Trichoglossum hirsutum]
MEPPATPHDPPSLRLPVGYEIPRDQPARKLAAVSSSGGDGNILSQLAGNPFFTAGFGLASLGAGLALVQRGVRQGAALLKRRLLVDLEISRNDESYQWFLHWMSQFQRAQISNTSVLQSRRIAADVAGSRAETPDRKVATTKEKTGILSAVIKRLTPGLHHLSIQTSKINNPNGSLNTHFSLIPGPGRHILRYKNTFIAVKRERETKSMNLQTGSPWETVTLTTLYSQRHIFEALFTEAHQLAMQLQEGKTVIFTAWGTEWRPFGQPRRKRPLESVVLDEGIKERIVKDVKDFLGSGRWYFDRGIPYRRGYLLHGPPGSGKTSFIQALAGELDYNISLLNLSERGLTDDRLNHLLTNVPARTIVLLEDVDAAFGNRRIQTDTDGYRGANVTFSGLLNALDGVASAEERIVFLTTNHADRLDDALVRPGRVDMAVHLGPATRWQVERLWDRFYGDDGHHLLDPHGDGKRRFVRELERLGLLGGGGRGTTTGTSTAALQGLFLYHKGDVEGAIRAADSLLDGAVVATNPPTTAAAAAVASSSIPTPRKAGLSIP